jgi:hypothetical protein
MQNKNCCLYCNSLIIEDHFTTIQYDNFCFDDSGKYLSIYTFVSVSLPSILCKKRFTLKGQCLNYLHGICSTWGATIWYGIRNFPNPNNELCNEIALTIPDNVQDAITLNCDY